MFENFQVDRSKRRNVNKLNKLNEIIGMNEPVEIVHEK